ncbi:hypothetical protein [Methylomonas koyamae]|uniref:Uncharacterized protein n=1 Tax=Methylomonas koyamae TaxID=702114 RepID=A0A291IGX0_9GAMM|nr:hypothetical protein [Methylomonas koyamae]ATG89593.1 hypothetical protein MKLM6_1338 [Methylomonas koyamae]OAI23469.1 hypothetical protein A1356_01560 [Methylomonas koyamae]
MKSVIQFLVILATLAGMVILSFFSKSMDEGNASASMYYGILAILIISAFILLFRWDKRRIQKEELELRQRVDARVRVALNSKHPVEFYARPSQFVFLVFIFILSLGSIYLGVYLLSDLPSTEWLLGAAFLSGGILFSIASIALGIRLIGRPVIRLDLRGVKHFRFGFIPWSEVTDVFLQTVVIKGNQVFSLRVATINKSIYLARLPRWLRVFHKLEPGGLSLPLPLSEEDARVVDGVAKGYANHAGAPTIEQKISRRVVDEISSIQTSQQRIKRLHKLMTETSGEFEKRRQEISRINMLYSVILILGVIAIFVRAWVKSK